MRVALIFAVVAALSAAQTTAKRDAGGYPAPTAALERGRTVYVTSSCHFCHGIDLTAAAMGAANLMSSKLVGRDENGNLIGAVVRAGLPNLQTAMPQYSDYTDQQIRDLAAYVHYLRQQGRYKELTALSESAPGDAKQGHDYFYGAAHCDRCHSPEGDLARVATKYKPAVLRARLLRPEAADRGAAPGPTAHRTLLENYSNDDVRNLLAYLTTMK